MRCYPPKNQENTPKFVASLCRIAQNFLPHPLLAACLFMPGLIVGIRAMGWIQPYVNVKYAQVECQVTVSPQKKAL